MQKERLLLLPYTQIEMVILLGLEVVVEAASAIIHHPTSNGTSAQRRWQFSRNCICGNPQKSSNCDALNSSQTKRLKVVVQPMKRG